MDINMGIATKIRKNTMAGSKKRIPSKFACLRRRLKYDMLFPIKTILITKWKDHS
jgi:hypothetical protein